MPDYLDRESYVGINFDDTVLKKCRGYYSRVKKHMIQTEPDVPKWMLESSLSIEASGIEAEKWTVHFFYDGHVVLWESPLKKLSGPDAASVRALSVALIAAGWKRIEPALHEIDSSPLFWKQLWTTGIVDSRQMTQQYGERKIFGD